MDPAQLVERIAVSALRYYKAMEDADTMPNDYPAAELVEAHRMARERFNEMLECIMDLAEA